MPCRSHSVPAALFLITMLLASCGSSATAEPAGLLNITVSIVPQKYFVDRIGGHRVQVNVMVGQRDEPHTYEPKPEQLKLLARSRAYMRIRVEFEDVWLDRIAAANPSMLIIDTTRNIQRSPVAAPHLHDEEPLADEEDLPNEGEAANLDPHIWLSPTLVRVQARTIFEALVQLDPDHQDEYARNLQEFLGDIDSVDHDIRETLDQLPVRKFMVFHPSWGYFARDYGLDMVPVEIGGQEPSAAEMAALINVAREEQIGVIFAQPELSTRAAETVASEIGGEVLLISPLAPDWLENLRRVADAFAKALSRQQMAAGSNMRETSTRQET